MACQLIGKVVGPAGADGQDGQDGTSAVITGATATASGLPAGSTPTVTVTAGGTSSSRSFAFAFGIPAGAKGDPGDDGQDGQDGPNRVTSETATTLTGILKGNGSTVTTATAGTDYGTYSKPAGGIPTSDLASVDSSPDSTHTANLISSAGVANALAKAIIKVALGSKTGTGSSVTWSKSNAAITADHEVLAYDLGTPVAQVGNLSWTTSAGAISVSGNINGTTTLTVILGIVGTSVT